jgi:hypothetical protein
VQVQQRKHLADLRGRARPRRQDRRREPLPLTGIRVDTLVVDPRCRDVHHAGARGHGPRLVAAVAHHQPMTLLVTNVNELGDVSVDLRAQGLGQHPPRTLSDDLVEHRRRSRPRRTRTIAVSRIRNYSEHRVVPSRPALSRRSCLEPFIGHPGRYAPSQADPQISSIAPDRSCPTLTMRGSWRHFPGHQLRVSKSRHRRRPCGRHRTSGRDADPGRAGRDEQQSNLDGFHAGYFVGASIGAYCPKYAGHT